MSVDGVIAFACFMLYGLGGQKIMPVFSKVGIGKYLNKVIGGTFIGVGIGLCRRQG